MAGSGKTTLLQRINTYLHEKQRPGYLINLDPAVADTPYEPNIDIRDTVRAPPAMSAASQPCPVSLKQALRRSSTRMS